MPAFKWTPWWGTLPEWLATVGTLLAFVVALRLLFKELESRREDVDVRLRAQARLVAAWVAQISSDETRARRRTTCHLLTRNGSDEPVHNVTVTLCERGSAKDSLHERATRGYSLLAPQTTEAFGPVYLEEELYFAWASLTVSVAFRDSQGYSWLWEPNGILTILAGPPSQEKRRRRSIKDILAAFVRGRRTPRTPDNKVRRRGRECVSAYCQRGVPAGPGCG
jgi:hypothetical protein